MYRLAQNKRFVGHIFDVYNERWKRDDGTVVDRDIVRKPGAVAIIASDAEGFWLVRQPREAIAAETSLEVPAGLLDVAEEGPLASAQRELAEECGVKAAHWEHVRTFYTSVGFTDERTWLYWATGLSECERPPADDDCEPFKFPMGDLGHHAELNSDAKTIIALEWLRSRHRA